MQTGCLAGLYPWCCVDVAVAEALLATEDAFRNRYLLPTKRAPMGAYQGWTLIFQFPNASQAAVDEAVADHGLEACLAVDAACRAGGAKVLAAANRVTGAAQPHVEFRRAAALTELFLRTNSLFRSAYMLSKNISASPAPHRAALCAGAFRSVWSGLHEALSEWPAKFPAEGADFNIVAPSPQLVGHHTKYMWPVEMLQYVNGSAAIGWACR